MEVINNIAEEFSDLVNIQFDSIDATGIALDLLGRNIVNTIILGYFAKNSRLWARITSE